MLKYTLIAAVILGLFFGLSLVAQEQSPDTVRPTGPQPQIFIPEQSFDFGFSPEGFFLVHPFKIVNEGEGDLVIERVRTTCGCTNAPLKKSELAPGEETEVTIIFNSARYRSRTSKRTIISSNDPMNRSVNITINANMDSIGSPFKVEPLGLSIPRGEKAPQKMTFTVHNDSEESYELTIVSHTPDVLQQPKIKDEKLKAGKSTTVEVSLRDDFDSSAKLIQASITIDAKANDNTVRFTLPIMGAGPM